MATADYEAALVLKQKGNEAFKSQNHKNALKYYSQIITYLGMNSVMNIRQVTTDTGRQNPWKPSSRTQIQVKTDELRLVAFNNMAAVYLKTQQFDLAIEKTTRILDDQPGNRKALFRRAMAFRKLGRLNDAYRDLSSASSSKYLDQVDPAIQRELALVNE
eukprot:202375_1